MSSLNAYHQSLGATLAQDNIPLHYGNLTEAYHAALNNAILLDRSHEGRIFLTGDNRFEIVNRISTNKIVNMPLHSGQATIFTNANARILYRVVAYNRPEGLLIITEPGQGDAITSYLQRNIFYGDKVNVINIQAQTTHFAIHGATATQVMQSLSPDLAELPTLSSAEIEHPTATFTVLRRKPIIGSHWAILCQQQHAEAIHHHLLTIGAPSGLTPAGSLTYNTLRIRSGRPAGQELSTDYIPLEIGLWDEVSFNKGCYTGQEIIARMESRQRLAKALVKIQLSQFIEAPATVYMDNKAVGTMTSSVQAPDDNIFANAVLKMDATQPNTSLTVGEQHINATVMGYAGEQPAFITGESS